MKRKLRMRDKNITKILIFFTAILLGICIACEEASLKTNGNSAQNAPEKKISEFEKDLESLRTANFDYIFVFRRKDGGAMDGEDKAFLNANLPRHLINRIIVSDDDKAVIAGSNYKLPPESLEKVRARFDVEDFSTVKENEK